MSIQEQYSTRTDLMALYDLPENARKRFELMRGVIYEVPTGTPLHAWIIWALARIIGNFVVENDLGYVFGDSIEYHLPNGDIFIPDVTFVSKQHQPTLPAQFTIAPDLAVEVFSPSNRERGMTEKIESYLESGTRRVWVIYPESKLVEVYSRVDDKALLLRKVTLDGTLDGEDVLPGLQIPVRDLFPEE